MIHPLNQWVLHSCSSMPLKSLQTRIILFLFPSPATAHNSINLIAWSGSMRFPPYLVLPIWPRHLLAPKICLQCQEAKTTPYHQIGDLIPLGGGGAGLHVPLPSLSFSLGWRGRHSCQQQNLSCLTNHLTLPPSPKIMPCG